MKKSKNLNPRGRNIDIILDQTNWIKNENLIIKVVYMEVEINVHGTNPTWFTCTKAKTPSLFKPYL